jgi:mannose-6-phosphate isomerase
VTSLAPFRTAPRFLDKTWGDGSRMRARFGLPAPPATGEAWLISGLDAVPSQVLDGPFAGRTLPDVVREAGPALLGALPAAEGFPLLVKLIEVAAQISVQVHPDGPTAQALGDGLRGKSETWLVLDAGPGAALDLGLRQPLEPDEVVARARAGTLADALDRRAPRVGTSYEILPGTLHSALDLLALEVQESSDVTYRVFDWGRDRPLHVEKAREALARTGGHRRRPHVVEPRGPRTALSSQAAPFGFDLLEVAAGQTVVLDPQAEATPGVAILLDGEATLLSGDVSLTLRPGEAAVLPAAGRRLVALRAGPAGARLAHAAPRLRGV